MEEWHRQVHRALIDAGYEPAVASRGVLAYRGIFRAGAENVPILLELDVDMVDPPTITLLERPDRLKPPTPHISKEGVLCYLDSSLSSIDPLRPGPMIGACLEKAQELLEDLSAGRKDQDAELEFPILWDPDFAAPFSTLPSGFSGQASLCLFEGAEKMWVLSPSECEAKNFARAWNGDLAVREEFPAWVLKSAKPLRPTQPWPITSPQQFLAYLRSVAPPLAQQFRESVDLRRGSRMVIVVCAPNAAIGGLLEIPKRYRLLEEFRNRQQALLKAFDRESWPLKRLTFRNMNQAFMTSRNLGSSGLAGKKVMLIGCGTIGGFLAEMLLKIGAGTDGGHLRLVDKDELLPGNLGRHVLGIRYLQQNKAAACKAYLGEPLGPATVETWTRDVRKLTKIFPQYDLIIDATGEEGLSNWLNLQRVNYLGASSFPPILHTWLEGPGAAGVAFMNDWPQTGCYRCLATPDGKARFRTLSGDADDSGIVIASCAESSFVRYPVSASTHTAALALQLVIDWLNADSKRSLRHIQIDPSRARASGSHNVTPIKGCPACSHRFSSQQEMSEV